LFKGFSIKKLAILLLISSIALVTAACSDSSTNKSQSATAWNKIKDKGEIVVATSGTLYPASFHDSKTNKLTGYEVEVAREVAKRLGLKVKFKEIAFDATLTSLNSGQVDIGASVGVTEKRKEKFAFSVPTEYSFGSVIVRKNDLSGIKKLEDIKGKRAAGEETTTYMAVARKLGAKEVIYDNATNEQYLRDVATGRTDVILNDYYMEKLAVTYFPKLNITIHPDIRFNQSAAALVMKKDNTELVKNVNKALNEMIKDGTMSKISKQFFAGADISKKQKMNIPTYETD
jgi:L-cystine transport system substrate-binding protein